jgi:hypothetical protein
MTAQRPPVDDRRRIAVKYLTLGLIIGLFFAPRAGGETWKAFISALQDLTGGPGGNEFADPPA